MFFGMLKSFFRAKKRTWPSIIFVGIVTQQLIDSWL